MPGRFPIAIFVFAFLGWTFDFYDLVLLGFLKDHVAHDLASVAHGRVVAARRGARRVGDRRPRRRRAGRQARQADDPLRHRAGLFARIADLRPGAERDGLLRGTADARDRRGRRVGDRPRHAGGGRRPADARPGGGGPAGGRAGRRGDRRLVGYLVLPRVGWRAVLLGSSVTALLAVAARASVHLPNRPAVEPRTSPSCAPPCASPGSSAASPPPGCSACSSSALTGAATPGCRPSSATACTRASAARSPGW